MVTPRDLIQSILASIEELEALPASTLDNAQSEVTPVLKSVDGQLGNLIDAIADGLE